MRITYYLFKTTVTSFGQVWKDGKGAPKGTYKQIRLKDAVPFEAEAYLQANKPATPNWLPYVLPYCAIPKNRIPLNRSSSFVLLLKVKGRIFSATFGQGFAALDRGKLEPDFGLRVTLNTVNPKRLRSLQARNIDPTTVSKQLVVNQDSSLAVFDVDFYQDLLARIDGVPDDSRFGRRISGADACFLTSDTAFPELGAKCERLLKCSRAKAYAKHFSFIDQVRPIRDEALVAELDKKLAKAMKDSDTSSLGFALPDIARYDLIHNYQVRRRRWKETFDDLSADEILDAYNGARPDADDHSQVCVDALTDDGTPVCDFTLRQCAVFQVVHKQRVYVLTLNKWYVVDQDYATRVDKHVGDLAVIKKKGFLPGLSSGTHEGEYNKAAADGKRFVLMDKKTVRPAGATSSIEVCDLFSAKREFVHVKRHTRSATLSHLLSQGTVSARLFVDDRGYRKTFRKSLPTTLQPLIDIDRAEPDKFTVVYAISAPKDKSLPSDLPFFTKVNLLFHCRELQRMGVMPKLFHIAEFVG